jgi:signal peptidase I
VENNPFFEAPAKKKRNWFVLVLEVLVIITSVSIVLYMTIISPNEVDGPSMEPNFYTHQLYFANKLVQFFDGTSFGKITGLEYKRGDVVVLQLPEKHPFIKRIVGLPHDRVAIRDGYIYINNKKLIEDYLPPARFTNGGNFIESGAEAKEVPEGSFFVVGDNRPVSNDSRYEEVGFIKRQYMKGKVFLRFYPLEVFGLIPTGTYKLIDE